MDTTSPIEWLCETFIRDMQALHKNNVYEVCSLLLCASDLRIDSTRIRRAIQKLEREQPAVGSDVEDLLQTVLRQLVFTRFKTSQKSRKEFLEYWLEQKNYKGRDIVAISFLVNLALENQELLTPDANKYVLNWHISHPEIKADRVNAWAVYCLNKAGYEDAARQKCIFFLAQREKNGSWGNDLSRTIACAYPLVCSGLLVLDRLDSTIKYILNKLERGFAYGIATRASALKLLYLLDKVPSSIYEKTYNQIVNDGSIFISHNSLDKPFARKLSGDLESEGIRTWVDEAEILPGDSIVEKIESGIEEMQYLGIVLSPRSVQSAWVRQELDMALVEGLAAREIKVLPLLIEDCIIPLSLRHIKYADFCYDYDSGLKNLFRGLRPEMKI